MPYKTTADLPPAVKTALHGAAQSLWLKVFNESAAAGDDEATSFKKAWAEVKTQYNRLGPKGGMWKNEELPAMNETGHIDLYLSDVTSAVEIVTAENGNLMAKGLPVLQVGTWNGKDYSAADLIALAANHAEIQASDSWEPPMRPYHAYDREGKPVSHSASETLGWHKSLRYDEPTQRLLADVELVDRQTAADMISGKLRYVSSEVGRDAYTSPVTGKSYDRAYMGGAFVDNPAVKGMPWQIVLNAAEFGHGNGEYEELPGAEIDALADTTEAAGMKQSMLPASCFLIVGHAMKSGSWALPYRDADPASPLDDTGRHTKAGPINCGRIRSIASVLKGGMGSTITPADLSPAAVSKLKAAARACGMTSAVIDELFDQSAGTSGTTAGIPGKEGAKSMGLIETLKAKFKGHGVPDAELAELDQLSEAPTPDPPAAPTPPTAAPPPDDGLRRQVELHEQTIQTLQATIDGQATEARHTQAQAQVEKWVTGGVLPPAKAVACYALLDALMAAPGGEVDVLADDGTTTRKATALDLFGEIVTGSAPIHVGNPRGLVLMLATDDPGGSKLLTEDELKRMAGK